MAKRRGNNEGSIFRRKNGTWRAQVTLDGKRLSFSAKTRTECQEWLKRNINQIDDGMTYASTKKTIKDYMTGWLNSSKISMRRTTWVQYEQVTRDYIIPHIGHIKIRDLRPGQIQVLYGLLLEKKVGIHTVIKAHRILHSALSHAVKTGIISRNPASVVILPKEPSKEMEIYDKNQVSQMLLAARGHRWEALYYLAVTTGMRQMELLGLKWIDINWKQKTIKVMRQLLRTASGEGIKFGELKTKYSKRTISLGEKAIRVLKSHHKRQHDEEQAAEERWVKHDLIFTNSIGNPINQRNLLNNFKKLIMAAGLPNIRFHDLRHTSASLMLNYGVPVIIVSRRLGHAKPSITLDVYGHLIPTMQDEVAEMIDELVMPLELHQIAPD